jgi:hypothetical protein
MIGVSSESFGGGDVLEGVLQNTFRDHVSLFRVTTCVKLQVVIIAFYCVRNT